MYPSKNNYPSKSIIFKLDICSRRRYKKAVKSIQQMHVSLIYHFVLSYTLGGGGWELLLPHPHPPAWFLILERNRFGLRPVMMKSKCHGFSVPKLYGESFFAIPATCAVFMVNVKSKGDFGNFKSSRFLIFCARWCTFISESIFTVCTTTEIEV